MDDSTLTPVRVLAQRFMPDGVADPAWPPGGLLACPPLFSSRGPVAQLVPDDAGGFYTVLQDYRNSPPSSPFGDTDIYAQHVLGSGALAPGWPADALPVSTQPRATDQDPSLCEDGHGGVFVVWDDNRAGYPQVFGLHLAPDGQRLAGWPAEGRLLSHALTFGLLPRLAWDAKDGAYLTWMELTALGYRGFVKHLTANGAPAPGWPADGLPVAATAGDQYEPAIVEDGVTGAIVAWADARQTATTFDIYAQRYVQDGVVAAHVSLASAEADPGEVRLRWQVSGESRASVERREGGGDWQVRAGIEADGGGYMSFVDREVSPGLQYGYRLAFASGARGGEVSLDVPAAFALALEGARPNPASGALWVAFTLPDAAAARLELFDLAGRRLAGRDVGPRGAGRHLVRLDDGALAPGLYWATLTQGPRTLRARVAMVN